jgi:paraquat-inducible protein A
MYNQPVADASLVGCPHCDLLQHLPDLAPGASARCPRCNEELWRYRADSLNRNARAGDRRGAALRDGEFLPMLGLTIVGREAQTPMLAVESFDPCLIWDAVNMKEVAHG